MPPGTTRDSGRCSTVTSAGGYIQLSSCSCFYQPFFFPYGQCSEHTFCMHQAQFVIGVIGCFLPAVDQVVATVAGDSRLSIVRLVSCAAGASEPVMCQHTGFRVAVAVPGNPDGAFATTRRFAKVSHNHLHIRLRHRESGRGGFFSSTSCALTVQVIKS
ncbi:hypothetical protein SB00175_03639 [Klebsiella oxytoca]|nr:Uncharacterised protein [Klebsiella oxytoca]VGP33407.1 hypothetical protein SB00175_03639 [Klebsiella oxytoca]